MSDITRESGRGSFRLLYPPDVPARGAPLPDAGFFHTLQIDQMVSVRRESWRGLPDLRLEQFYATDPAVLAWRLDVVADLVDSEALHSLLQDALPMLRDAAEMRKVLNSSSSTVESSLASVRYLEIYLELVELFHARLAAAQIHSDGFAALRNEVEARRSSRDYQTLSRQLEQTQYQIGHVKSIALGVNLDGTLRVTDVGVLSINTEKIPPGQRAGQAAGPGQGRPHGVHLRLCQPGQDRPGGGKTRPGPGGLPGAGHRLCKDHPELEPVIDQYFRDETAFLHRAAGRFPVFCRRRSAFCCSFGRWGAPCAARRSAPWRKRPCG